MKDGSIALLAVGLAGLGAAFVWLQRKPVGANGPFVVPSSTRTPSDPNQGPIAFPSLKVGDGIMVDSAKAALPSPFNLTPQVPMRVDLILSDSSLISASAGIDAPSLPHFSGSIPRASIISVILVS